MPTKPISIAGAAGHDLSGRIEMPPGPVRGWAIFAHCFTCTKDSMAAVRISRALAGHGIGVLRFDFMGLGESGGAFADTSFSIDVADLVAAAEAMTAAAMAPLLLVGHSLGGAAVLAAAGQIPSIKAVATIGAPFAIEHVARQVGNATVARIEAEGEADVRLGGRPFRLKKSFLDDLEQHDQGARIGALGRPLLVLHAPLDETVAVEEAGRIFMAARHPKSFAALDGADHLLARKADCDYAAGLIAAWASRYIPA